MLLAQNLRPPTAALPFVTHRLCCGSPLRVPKQRFGSFPAKCRRKPGFPDMAKVAFLGLGVMGFPMAGHLAAKGGHQVTVYNRTEAKAKAWAEKFGGRAAPTPQAAAEGQDFVMACVGNDNDLRAITVGPNGAFGGMKSGSIFVDHTTASAEVARE